MLGLEGQKLVVLLLTIILVVIFYLQNPAFLSSHSIGNILRTASMLGIVALGMTLVIIAREIDLSVGSMMALGGVLGAGLLGTVFGAGNPIALPIFVAVPLALLMTAGLGALSGLLTTKLALASFVVTLGMMSVARGLTFIFANYVVQGVSGTGLTFSDPFLSWLGAGAIGPLPTQTVLFLGLAAVLTLGLKYTAAGRSVFAVGGDAEHARLSGINTGRVVVGVFAISGLLAGLGGLILTGRLSSASPLAASGYELDVIMIVVIGGTSLAEGGRGSIGGTVLGALLVSVLDNGMNIINVPSFYQLLVKGVVLVGAVVADRVYRSRQSRAVARSTAA